jgi:hypothetical protein
MIVFFLICLTVLAPVVLGVLVARLEERKEKR